MSKDSKPKVITKTVTKPARTNLSDALKVVLEKGEVEYFRIFSGGPSDKCPHEAIFHRPIGITELSNEDWVSSEVGAVAQLLSRQKDPDEKDLIRKRQKAVRDSAVAKKLISDIADDGVLSYKDKTNRSDFLKAPREAAQKQVQLAKKAYKTWKDTKDKRSRGAAPPLPKALSAYLVEILELEQTSANAKEELAYIKHCNDASVTSAAKELHPSTYETMSGPSFDVPQHAIAWAHGMSVAQVKTECAKMIGFLGNGDATKLGDAIKDCVKK